MNEATRRHYLAAMGIGSFVPRYVLPNAKPSRALVLAPQFQPESQSERPRPPRDIQAADVVMPQEGANAAGRSVAPLVDEAPVELPPQIDPSTQVGAPPARFSLALWHYGSSVTIVDSREPEEALPTQALLNNMLFHCAPASERLSKAEYLQWPLGPQDGDVSWDAAREMVAAFFDGRLAMQSTSRFLLCGEDASRAMMVEGWRETYRRGEIPELATPTLQIPSLATLLRYPQEKQRVWSELRAFLNEALN